MIEHFSALLNATLDWLHLPDSLTREKRLKELGRPLLEEAVQKLADCQALSCPRCGGKLHVKRHQTASGRSVITERGYVATRQGLEAFEQQLSAEALQRGLTKAKSAEKTR